MKPDGRFTPGPWQYGESRVFVDGAWEEPMWQVCTVEDAEGSSDVITESWSLTRGDARLIAAAPDLLAFAESVASWHHDGLCPAGPINDGPCRCFVGKAQALVRDLVPPPTMADNG